MRAIEQPGREHRRREGGNAREPDAPAGEPRQGRQDDGLDDETERRRRCAKLRNGVRMVSGAHAARSHGMRRRSPNVGPCKDEVVQAFQLAPAERHGVEDQPATKLMKRGS